MTELEDTLGYLSDVYSAIQGDFGGSEITLRISTVRNGREMKGTEKTFNNTLSELIIDAMIGIISKQQAIEEAGCTNVLHIKGH